MRHTLPIAPQFYVTAPQSCPYLDERRERKLFTALQGDQAEKLNNALSKQGFRRSQNVLYRPSCTDCTACLSARIRVADFKPKRGQKRVMTRNRGLERHAKSAWATEEQYALFRAYLDARHADGGMADMDVFEFAAMIEETPVRTRVIEYRDTEAFDQGISNDEGEAPLAAVCLTDILDDGVSLVYSFFDPDLRHRSLGTYVILDHVALAAGLGLPYVYLGYWVPGSAKMGYKASFPALEVYADGIWQPLRDPSAFSDQTHPLSIDPIAQQVAQISLPDMREK